MALIPWSLTEDRRYVLVVYPQKGSLLYKRTYLLFIRRDYAFHSALTYLQQVIPILALR